MTPAVPVTGRSVSGAGRLAPLRAAGRHLLYGVLGAAAGAGGLLAAARCTGACSSCFGCAGGALLVALAAFHRPLGRRKRERKEQTWNGSDRPSTMA